MDDSGSKSQTYWQARDAERSSENNVKRDVECDSICDTERDAVRSGERLTLGMDSFNAKDRNRFGQNLRLSMAFMDGAKPSPTTRPESAMPRNAPAIAQRLKHLGQDITSNTADQLELLVRFDELEGWRASGARHCVAWMNLELGVGQALGWEYLRAGRQLRLLPITTALFRAGRLSWSKVRLISRVASLENEGGLCHAALDASVSDLERLCKQYRWEESVDDKDAADSIADAENARYLRQYNARSLTWNTASNGNTVLHLSLPADLAQAFLKGIEHNLQQLDITKDSMSQRRADAAVLMAESSLQIAGNSVSNADRYQVIVSVDASQLAESSASDSAAQGASTNANTDSLCDVGDDDTDANSNSNSNSNSTESGPSIPAKRPMLSGVDPITQETARRIACDCSVSVIVQSNDEPLSIGRKSRLWKPAMARAIKLRDQHCQFPGCSQTNHLQIHHIKHWANGGTTSVDNGVCLCHAHHILLHEGGYRVERVSLTANGIDEQFKRQRAMSGQNTRSRQRNGSGQSTKSDQSDAPEYKNREEYVNEVEAALRNSRESFEFVRRLSPTRFRFRFVDRHGRDVRDDFRECDLENSLVAKPAKPILAIHPSHSLPENMAKEPGCPTRVDHKKYDEDHSTRVDHNKCGESHSTESGKSPYTDTRLRKGDSGVAEQAANYELPAES